MVGTGYQEVLSPMARNFLNATRPPRPKYKCRNCKSCVGTTCTFYHRPVDTRVNSCYNHSKYNPVATTYRSPDNIVEIALANEEKRYG